MSENKPVNLEMPKFLDVPDKILPMLLRFNEFRYFLLDGGRGSGKTHSVSRLMLYLAEQKKLRIVCGRETQNTIEESVYTVLKDMILEFDLNYDIFRDRIVHRTTGSTFIFRGFREQGATNIKGLEGVDILWVDEAQAITKRTLDVIIPTIRKEKAKIFWTMNRHVVDDPVYIEFANREDCLNLKCNYNENKHCPEVLLHEAEVCKARSELDYNHIWLGEPLPKSDDYLFSLENLQRSLHLDLNRIGISKRVLGNDVARFGDCENVFTVIESRGPIFWEQIHQEAFKGLGLDETVGKNLSLSKEMGLDLSVIDDDGMGGGVTDNLHGIEVIPFRSMKDFKDENYTDRRTAGYFKLQEWMERGWFKIINDPILHSQLLNIRYRYHISGKKRLFTKDEMRKEGVESPDRADALMMAVYYADYALQNNRQFGYADTSMSLDQMVNTSNGLPTEARMS